MLQIDSTFVLVLPKTPESNTRPFVVNIDWVRHADATSLSHHKEYLVNLRGVQSSGTGTLQQGVHGVRCRHCTVPVHYGLLRLTASTA